MNETRWFKVWLTVGGLLAVLLLVNSVLNYEFVSRRMAMEQLRHELNRQVAAFEQQARQTGQTPVDILAREFAKDRDKTPWIEIRDRDGNVLAHEGIHAGPTFSEQDMRERMRTREPVVKVRKTEAGDVLVESFPIRLAPPAPGQKPSFAVIEIAASLDAANAVFWPVRRNLIINCSAALALLVSLVLMAIRFKQYVQGKQLEQQLEIARKVQQDLLPAPASAPKQVDVAARCIPALSVGGDFYDVFQANPNRVGVLTGDVSGKGMPAALLMGVLHGAVRSSNWADSRKDHEDATRRINQLLCERASGERYATMFWSYFDTRSHTLHYINAGHCAPMLVRSRQGRKELLGLEEGGPVLGLLPRARYEQASITLEPGDFLVVYSDGVIEAANAAGEEFGEERLRALLESSNEQTAAGVEERILTAVRTFVGNEEPQDDLTLAVVRFQPAMFPVDRESRIREMETV